MGTTKYTEYTERRERVGSRVDGEVVVAKNAKESVRG